MAAAVLEHAVRGRARLRFVGERGDAQFFAKAETALRAVPGVTDVEVTSGTGSIVIHYQGTWEAIERAVAAGGLITVTQKPPGPSPLERVSRLVGGLNDKLAQSSPGNADLRSLAALGLLGAAAIQVLRGKILPPGVNLISFAYTLARESLRESKQEPVRESVKAP